MAGCVEAAAEIAGAVVQTISDLCPGSSICLVLYDKFYTWLGASFSNALFFWDVWRKEFMAVRPLEVPHC